ncbi:MAG TPA: DUF928 domain-containing protein [Allocoleopsis sp.]
MNPLTSSYRITVAAVLATGFLGTSQLPATASIQLTSVNRPSPSPQQILLAGRLGFKLNVRPSVYRVGGFTRGSCSSTDITVVSPPTQPEEHAPRQDVESVAVDSTISSHPTLFVNIPAEVSATKAELLVQNEAGDREIYDTTFQLTGKPGIVGIRIPNTAPPLEVGQKYQWQFSVFCDPNDSTDRLSTSSWIERISIDPTLASRIERATPREQLSIYAEAGIWQDMLSTLAELLYSNPNDQSLAQDWASLMQTVNLNNFANQPIVQIAGKQ